MAIDDVYVVTVTASMASGVVQNSYAFNRTISAEPTITDFAALADDLKELNRVSQIAALTYRGWKARQLRGDAVTWPSDDKCNPVGGLYFEGLYTTNLPGLQTGEALPPQCAQVTTVTTGEIGRRKRGRSYMGGVGEDQQIGGQISTALITSRTTAWTTFMAEYGIAAPPSGFRFGVWSTRTASGCGVDEDNPTHGRIDPPHPELAFTPATGFAVRPTIYTQRRRVLGVGL